MEIIDSTDKKYLGELINTKLIKVGEIINFSDGFIFEIMGVSEEDGIIQLSTPNYIIKLKEE